MRAVRTCRPQADWPMSCKPALVAASVGQTACSPAQSDLPTRAVRWFSPCRYHAPSQTWQAVEDRCPHRLAPLSGGGQASSLPAAIWCWCCSYLAPGAALLCCLLDVPAGCRNNQHLPDMCAEGRIEPQSGNLECR